MNHLSPRPGSPVTRGALALGALVLLFSSPAFAAKTQVCHVPPGNPANFHTISVSGKAAQKHVAHGDLLGSCNDHCATLCDDGNPCTIDDNGSCEQSGCAATRPAVNCDDGNACTADACDATKGGCVNAAQAGAACDDGEACTENDTCDAAGQCVAGPDTCSGPSCPAGASEFEGKCYIMADLAGAPIIKGIDGRTNYWLTSESYCAAAWGGHLASIQSAGENQFVASVLAAASSTGSTGGMIGFSDQGRATNSFAWLDGAAVTFTNWLPGEPSNNYTGRGREDCAQMTTTANASGPQWNDVPCTDGGPSVCEFTP